MAKIDNLPEFSFSWITVSHDEHPYGDLLWHLFWGIVVGVSILYAIIAKDFLYLVISLIALFFFFHPIFYEEKELRVRIDNTGVYVNDKKYSWEDILGFEISKIGDKYYLYFVPKHFLTLGAFLPLDEYMEIEEIRKTLNEFLDEHKGSIPNWEIIYRKFFK